MTADPDDPTYGYFLLYADPPPLSRTLPDARTDADAIQAAVEAACDDVRRHVKLVLPRFRCSVNAFTGSSEHIEGTVSLF